MKRKRHGGKKQFRRSTGRVDNWKKNESRERGSSWKRESVSKKEGGFVKDQELLKSESHERHGLRGC